MSSISTETWVDKIPARERPRIREADDEIADGLIRASKQRLQNLKDVKETFSMEGVMGVGDMLGDHTRQLNTQKSFYKFFLFFKARRVKEAKAELGVLRMALLEQMEACRERIVAEKVTSWSTVEEIEKETGKKWVNSKLCASSGNYVGLDDLGELVEDEAHYKKMCEQGNLIVKKLEFFLHHLKTNWKEQKVGPWIRHEWSRFFGSAFDMGWGVMKRE